MDVRIKDIDLIGTVKVVMVKGEKGDVGNPTDSQVLTAVSEWLSAHPEATTTVQDGAITEAKLANDVKHMFGTKADAIVKTASGSIASFADGGDDLPMKSLKVNIVPKQSGSGDPSPSNVRAISGWDAVDTNVTGANIWDETWENGWINSQGQEVSGTTIRTKFIPIKPNTAYYINTDKFGDIYCYDSNKAFIGTAPYTAQGSGYVITTRPNTAYIRVPFISSYGTTYNNDISINYPSTDTEYHPYDGQTITTNLGQTVYGGVSEVVSGKLTNTLRRIIIPNDTPVNLRSSGDGVKRYVASISELRTEPYKGMENNAGFLIASKLTKGNGYSGTSPYLAFLDVGNLYFTVPDTMTDTDASSLVRGMELVYELVTPTEIQLTPTEVKSLLGANNAWSESGTVEVEYRADTTLAYNELLSLIASLS